MTKEIEYNAILCSLTANHILELQMHSNSHFSEQQASKT